MELRSKGKMLFLAMAVCITLSVVFSGTFAATILGHECIGDGCPYCQQITMAKIFLSTLKLAGVTFFAALCLIFLTHISPKYTDFPSCPFSPITLKVRFNT